MDATTTIDREQDEDVVADVDNRSSNDPVDARTTRIVELEAHLDERLPDEDVAESDADDAPRALTDLFDHTTAVKQTRLVDAALDRDGGRARLVLQHPTEPTKQIVYDLPLPDFDAPDPDNPLLQLCRSHGVSPSMIGDLDDVELHRTEDGTWLLPHTTINPAVGIFLRLPIYRLANDSEGDTYADLASLGGPLLVTTVFGTIATTTTAVVLGVSLATNPLLMFPVGALMALITTLIFATTTANHIANTDYVAPETARAETGQDDEVNGRIRRFSPEYYHVVPQDAEPDPQDASTQLDDNTDVGR